MELEQLKSIWKQSDPDFQRKGEVEIGLMLKGKSMSIIEKLKRSVWIELILTCVISMVLLVYAITLKPGAPKWTSVSLLLMCLGFSIYYVKKLALLNRFQGVNDNLQTTIRVLITNLKSYLRFYKNSYAILYPVYFSLGLLFGAIEKGPEKYIEFLFRPSTIISLLLLAVLFFIISTWFARWYIKKLYGNYLEKLQDLLDELQA